MLTYADSGPGLPANTDLEKGKNLGLLVIDSLAQQLGGGVEYDYQNKIFRITFHDIMGRKKVA